MNQTSGLNTGPLGSGTHTVLQGECLLSIAYDHGFLWETLWNLPGNAELRRVRKDPGLLLAGDQITIPERETKVVEAHTDKRHEFVLLVEPAKLRLVIEYEDKPISSAAYVLTVDGSILQGKTDQQGLLEESIPPNASHGVLEINGLSFDLELGTLDPSSEDIGIQQRLANLGFYHGELDGQIGPMTHEAIAVFQARVGLTVTGDLDDHTRQKILHRHDATHERLLDEAKPDPAPAPEDRQNG